MTRTSVPHIHVHLCSIAVSKQLVFNKCFLRERSSEQLSRGSHVCP